jgi:hypothetical protein
VSRQHAAPVLINSLGGPARSLTHLGPSEHGLSEAEIQSLIQGHPQCLPIAEIDPLFSNPVPICTELSTPVGPIDNFMVTATGLPVLVECKLWKNPQARREVVGQILDYANALSRWTTSDLQREASRRLKREGNALLDLVRAAGHEVDEAAFNDALSLNLRRGRFLLLIVGDGIREGVEAIAEYLQAHAGLHFTLGLVELPVYLTPDGGKLVVPRVLARTERIVRTVVEVPDGLSVEGVLAEEEASNDADRQQLADELANPTSRIRFWQDFVSGLRLNDPEVSLPKPGRNGFISLSPPFKIPSVWITIYRMEVRNEVGIYITFGADSTGQHMVKALLERWPDVMAEFGGSAVLDTMSNGRVTIGDLLTTGFWSNEDNRQSAFAWLRQRTNDLVNTFFPKLKLLVEELDD